MNTTVKTWSGAIGPCDDFGEPITTVFIDGKTRFGPWAIMTPESHKENGLGLGQGRGQRYEKRGTAWVRTEG